MTEELWKKILDDICSNPRDLQTVPLNGGDRWFHVSTDGDTIFGDNAKTKKPSSKLSQTRNLHKHEFVAMYEIYLRRKRGEMVSQEATKITRNQVCIYAIFCHCGRI
jgi:hypothetical protein